MLGINWVDILIVAAIGIAVAKAIQMGIYSQLGAVLGFFLGLFFAGWLFPHLLGFIDDRTLLTLINVNLVLIFAFYCGLKGYDLGTKLHSKSKSKKPKSIESFTGVIVAVISVLIIAWLVGATIGRLPFEGLSNSASDAYIVQKMNHHMPPVPAVLAEFNRLVDPNSEPYNFEEGKSIPKVAYSQAEFEKAKGAGESVVRITSFGCGGIAAGSGFTFAPELVATNAHVIAGVKRPIVKYQGRSYEGVPVLFDKGLDMAVVKVKGLPARPLSLDKQHITDGSTVAVLGYPGGNYTAIPGVVRNDIQLFGRNIYDLGVFNRDVYEIQTNVEPGSSGGPIVTSSGKVAGVIFAKSDEIDGYAYALTAEGISHNTDRAQKLKQRVSTGACLAN